MTLLRFIVALVVLLAQAMPAQAMLRENTAAKCEMGCCAWLAEAGTDSCDCTESSQPTTPADLPPAGVRQLMVQVVWADAHERGFSVPPPLSLNESDMRLMARDLLKQPHVRLQVLFCSLLN